jgi:CRISPR-associated protein Csx10
VEIKPDEAQANETEIKNDLKARVAAFNQKLRERWRLWEQLPCNGEPVHRPGEGTFFAVLLASDAILREGGWTPTVRLESQMLGKPLADAELLRCYANLDYRGGWNTGQRLPKDTDLIASMGGVYVYHTSRSLDDESLIEAMCELEEQGVGDRRVEGFGQARVCDEFHQVIQEAKKDEPN